MHNAVHASYARHHMTAAVCLNAGKITRLVLRILLQEEACHCLRELSSQGWGPTLPAALQTLTAAGRAVLRLPRHDALFITAVRRPQRRPLR